MKSQSGFRLTVPERNSLASAEKSFRAKVVAMLRPFHAVAVENAVGVPGMPDINCSLGWIELKSVSAPVKETTRVTIPHPDRVKLQKIWAMKRWEAGGMSCLLLKVDDWYLLFDAPTYFQFVGKLPLAALVERCYDGWFGSLPRDLFTQALLDLSARKNLR